MVVPLLSRNTVQGFVLRQFCFYHPIHLAVLYIFYDKRASFREWSRMLRIKTSVSGSEIDNYIHHLNATKFVENLDDISKLKTNIPRILTDIWLRIRQNGTNIYRGMLLFKKIINSVGMPQFSGLIVFCSSRTVWEGNALADMKQPHLFNHEKEGILANILKTLHQR